MSKKILIFGLGYVASYIAKNLSKENYNITITSRNASKRDLSDLIEYNSIDFNSEEEVEHHINMSDHIISSIPPFSDINTHSSYVDPVISKFGQVIQNAQQLRSIIYLSSTSVYGDHSGGYANETSKIFSTSKTGATRLRAEMEWSSMLKNQNLNIFRLSGIYGPWNNVLSRILAGTALSIHKNGHDLSRIHISDIASVVYSVINGEIFSPTTEIFNISDDRPCPTYEVNNYASDLLEKAHLPITAWDSNEVTPRMREFYINNKKIDNSKMKKYLLPKLAFPDYKAGLNKIFMDKEY